jgi:hypothetical protein
MTAFIVNLFGGLSPKVAPRLLIEKYAQKAVNVNLVSGELRSLRENLKIGDELLEKAGVKKSIYRFGQEQDETEYWFHWLTDVDVVRGNIADDTAERTYFTGDGVPKYTYSPLAITGGGTEYPYGSYTLGVIKPDLTNTDVAVTNRVITSITILGTTATVTTDEPHKLITGSKATIAGATDPLYNGDKTITVVDEDTFTYITTTAPVSDASGTLSFNYGGLPETRLYAISYVSALGEEGAPAIMTPYVEAITGQIVTFTDLPTAPAGNYNYTKKRIYRTATGSQQSTLRYVGEVTLATTTFVDDILATELAENNPALQYEAPPSDLKCLIGLPNGMMAGISKNMVCITPAYVPHAYPIGNRYSFNVKLVAIASFGQSIAVLTDGIPTVMTGSSPEGMSQQDVKVGQPCLSAQSVVEVANGVMWASDEGLAFINNNGFDLATKLLFSEREWALYYPDTIRAYRWKNRYVGFYDTGTEQKGFVFDPATYDFYELDFYATAGFTNPKNGNLYLAIDDDVYLFDGGDALTSTWKSKVFTTARPENMGVGKVIADVYPVTFKLFANGNIKHSKTVLNDKPFSLPAGYTANEFEVELSGTNSIRSFAIAGTVEELTLRVE